MEAQNNKENFNDTITKCNQLSYFYVIKILFVATILWAVYFMFLGFYLLNTFLIILLAILFYYYRYEHIIDNINLDNIKEFFLMFFITILFSAYFVIPLIYLVGLEFEFIKLIFHNALITPSLILNSQIMNIKTTNFYIKLYVTHSILLVINIYYFFPVQCFDKEIFLEIILGILVVLYTCTNIMTKNSILEEFVIKLWENDISLGKYSKNFNNAKAAQIIIDKTRQNIEINHSFQEILAKLGNHKALEQEFYNRELNKRIEVRENISNEEYKEFLSTIIEHKLLNNKASFLNNFFNNVNESEEVYLKQLFTLFKLFDMLYEKKESLSLTNKGIEIFKKLFLHNNLSDNVYFKHLGSFFTLKEENKDKIEMSLEISFENMTISGVEFLTITFIDTTEITQIESEKAYNQAKREYLSKVTDKFFTPIQVLVYCTNNILNYINKRTEKVIYEKVDEIQNLGNYIICLNKDISSYTLKSSLNDFNLEQFSFENLLISSQKTINILIKNSPTKCHAIKTEIILDDNIPKFINSDEIKVRQLFLNILSNAFKFTISGKITTIIKVIESNSIFDEIMIIVKDSGLGLSNEIKQVIKDLKENIIGDCNKNFGLQICKKLVNCIGDKFGYESTENGTSFYFSIYNIKNYKNLEFLEYVKNNMSLNLKDILLKEKRKRNDMSQGSPIDLFISEKKGNIS